MAPGCVAGEPGSLIILGVFIEVNGHRVNSVSFGSGPRTFLAHGGWVGSWEVWQQPFELMSDRWRCISYDHIGSGETVVPPESITPEALVADLVGVMDALNIEKCVLGGESLGSVVALGAVVEHPDRFEGLVLVDGAPRVTGAVRMLIEGARSDFPATIEWFVDACLPEPGSEHLKRWGRHILLRAEPESAARILECYKGHPAVPLEQVAVPTLVIHGTLDAIVPEALGRRMAAELPDATYLGLEGAGHVPTLTRPEAVVAAIEERFSFLLPAVAR